MNHLERLITQYYEWQGYVVRTNVNVGKRPQGGYEGELDICAFNPNDMSLFHIEPSLDADNWEKRELRFKKKFDAEIRARVMNEGVMAKRAIPERYDLLRTLQLSHCGYYRIF